MRLDDPTFPPLLTGHGIKSPLHPWDEACRLAGQGKLGAADCLWGRTTKRAIWAVVLEPEVPLSRAVQMGPLLQTALIDALGALMPPKVAVQLRWPDVVMINAAVAGSTLLRSAPCAVNEVPDWIVVGYDVVLHRDLKGLEPGDDEQRTSVAEEGAPELDRTRVIESTSAHFLTWLDIWGDEGFRPLHDQWLGRVEGRESDADFVHLGETIRGRALGLDDTVTLMVRPVDGPPRGLALLDTLTAGSGHPARPGVVAP